MSGRGRRHQGRENPLEFVQQWRERSRHELVTLSDGRMVTQEEHLQSLDTDRREELEQLRREAEYLMYIGGLPEEDFLNLRQQGLLGDRRFTTPEDLEARRQQLRRQATNQPAANQQAANQPAANQQAANQPAANQQAANQPAANQQAANQPAANQQAANQPAANQQTANQFAATQQAPLTRMQLRPRQSAQQTSPREGSQRGQDSGRRRGGTGVRGATARRRNNRPASATTPNRPSNNTSDTGNDASEEASTSSTTSTSTASRRGRGRRRRPSSATVSSSTQAGRANRRGPRPATASGGRRSSSQPSRGAGSVNRPRRHLTSRRRGRTREGSAASAFQQQLDMLAYQLFLRSFLEEDAMDGSDSSDFSDSWEEDYDSWEDFLEDELSDDESSDSWDGFLEVMGMFSPRDADMWNDVEVEEEEAPRGLTKDEIGQLPCRKFTRQDAQRLSGEGQENACTICMVDYKTGNKLRRLPCAHEFHSKCVDRWLKQNGSCPVCRQQVDISVNLPSAETQQPNQHI